MKFEPFTFYTLYEKNVEKVGGFEKSHLLPLYKTGNMWLTALIILDQSKVRIIKEDATSIPTYDQYIEQEGEGEDAEKESLQYGEESTDEEIRKIIDNKKVVNKLFDKLFTVVK